ncbi:MAG: A24 family peptidase [Lachnospiraceae bacterium]|nr:A24 family peptidase [Lachnospiraceae bacterium]
MWGLLEALGAAAIIFLAFYPFYRIGALGAGDVKLFMMMGCHCSELGVNGIICYLFGTMTIAAAITIVKMIAYAESRERLFYLGRYLRKAAMTGALDTYQIDKKQKRCVVRLSIPAFISLLLMCAGMYA